MVRIESHQAEFLREVVAKTRQARKDVAAAARSNPGAPSDTRLRRNQVGSSRAYARAQERGAYIRPRRRRVLKFADGSFRPRARIRAKRWLSKAGRRWGEFLERRLREVRV